MCQALHGLIHLLLKITKRFDSLLKNHIAKEVSELGFEFRQTSPNPCSEPLHGPVGYFPLKVNVYIPSFPQVPNIFLMMELKPRS